MLFDNTLSTDKASVTIFGEVPQEIITAGLLLSANMLRAKLVNPIVTVKRGMSIKCEYTPFKSHHIYDFNISWWHNGHFVLGQYANNVGILQHVHINSLDASEVLRQVESIVFPMIMEKLSDSPTR